MGEQKDETAVANLVEGAVDMLVDANQQVVQASAAIVTAGTMLTYAVAEMTTPPVTGLSEPALQA